MMPEGERSEILNINDALHTENKTPATYTNILLDRRCSRFTQRSMPACS